MKTDASDELAEMLLGAAKHRVVVNARLSIWLRLLRDQPSLGFAMADRPETPDEVLTCLALVGDRRTRSRLVMRNTLPAEVVELLESDLEVGSGVHVVHASDVDRNKLERLVNHRWASVRAVAKDRLESLVEGPQLDR